MAEGFGFEAEGRLCGFPSGQIRVVRHGRSLCMLDRVREIGSEWRYQLRAY